MVGEKEGGEGRYIARMSGALSAELRGPALK